MHSVSVILFFFFFNDTATTEIYTLSLHDALPISHRFCADSEVIPHARLVGFSSTWTYNSVHVDVESVVRDRKSTRLNSSHGYISYAVFCLKKKKRPASTHRPLLQPSHSHVRAVRD